jgi:protein-S-isoprenylcysteine O-methyltransferase Ste14
VAARKPSSELGFGAPTAIAVLALSALLFAALIFWPAGRIDWPAGWRCLAVMVIGFAGVTAHVAERTPSLIRRRARIGAGTPWWDRVLVPVFQLAFVAILVVAGRDAGRHPEDALPIWTQAIGLLAMAVSMLLLGWAMGANPHFEATVRIQSDRQHRVIDSGPYRIVRHPGYSAALLLLFGIALALGSAWALAPALLGALGLVLRTRLEEAFLAEWLDGYREYGRRTRYRLIPGVW